MRGAWLIFKKEYLELLKDRKTVFFTFLMPLILYPVIFGAMGSMMSKDRKGREGRPSRVLLVDPSGALKPVLEADPKLFELVKVPEGDLRQAIRDQKLEMAVTVASDAADKLAAQQTFDIKAQVDTSEDASSLAYRRLKDTLQKQDVRWVQARIQALKAPEQLAVPTKVERTDVADPGLFMGKLMGTILPYMIMMLMFAGAMQLGIYATAGEKDRGTLQTLLSTSLPRHQIILGKLAYIFSIGILSALVNTLAMSLSMGKMIAGQASTAAQAGVANPQAAAMANSSLAAFANPVTVGLIFMLMIPLGLLFANLILLAGIQAKSTQEATTAITPGVFVVLFMGMVSMGPGVEKMAWLSYVPVMNVSVAIRKLLSQQPYGLDVTLALVMTVGLAAAASWLSTRLLCRESAIFKV